MFKATLLFLMILAGPSFADFGCYRFFYVKRPVAFGTVYHEYVVAQREDLRESKAFGLLKGTDDLKHFLIAVKNPAKTDLKIKMLGRSCEANAERALSRANDASQEWTLFYENELYFVTRMGLTPLIGKPCRNMALSIAEMIEPLLERP